MYNINQIITFILNDDLEQVDTSTKGINVDMLTDPDDYTLLHHAVMNGNPEIVHLLLDRGADPNTRAINRWGNRAPLNLAAWSAAIYQDHDDDSYNYVMIVLLLILYGADLEARDQDQCTVLNDCFHGFDVNIKIVRTLLEYGADVNTEDEDGITPVTNAVYWKNSKVLDLLLKYGADPTKAEKQVSKIGDSKFKEECLTVLDSHKKKVGTLINNTCDSDGCVNINNVIAHLNYGKNDDTKYDGITPLRIAVNRNNTKVFKSLLDYGADPYEAERLVKKVEDIYLKDEFLTILKTHKKKVGTLINKTCNSDGSNQQDIFTRFVVSFIQPPIPNSNSIK